MKIWFVFGLKVIPKASQKHPKSNLKSTPKPTLGILKKRNACCDKPIIYKVSEGSLYKNPIIYCVFSTPVILVFFKSDVNTIARFCTQFVGHR